RPGLPQMVRQDPGRPPRRPPDLADQRTRASGNRPGALHLGTGQTRRPGPHAQRATAPARRRRPHPMANRPRPGPPQSSRGRSYGNWPRRMTSRLDQTATVLLTVEAAAERLSTSPRFIRRLIAERRIEFVKVGRHVRISESALHDFIDAGRVEPLANAHTRHKMRGVA